MESEEPRCPWKGWKKHYSVPVYHFDLVQIQKKIVHK